MRGEGLVNGTVGRSDVRCVIESSRTWSLHRDGNGYASHAFGNSTAWKPYVMCQRFLFYLPVKRQLTPGCWCSMHCSSVLKWKDT